MKPLMRSLQLLQVTAPIGKLCVLCRSQGGFREKEEELKGETGLGDLKRRNVVVGLSWGKVFPAGTMTMSIFSEGGFRVLLGALAVFAPA
jgi:hypothetical protein